MKLSQTKGAGMPRTVKRFWEEVEKTPPDPGCEDCKWPDGSACESCKALSAQSLINAERFA